MNDKNITNTMPTHWEFNDQVAKVFDEMLSRSIPSYHTFKEIYIQLLLKYTNEIPGQIRILDIGCGTLTSSLDLYEKIPNCTLIGIDKSTPMIKQAQNIARYRPGITLINKDITTFDVTEFQNIHIALIIFTLQFIPPEDRMSTLQKIYNTQQQGSIIILAEKTINPHPVTETLFTETYYKIKEQNQYTKNEINNKKRKLKRQLIPTTDEFNKELLKGAGYKNISIFWKSLNFTGYIGYK